MPPGSDSPPVRQDAKQRARRRGASRFAVARHPRGFTPRSRGWVQPFVKLPRAVARTGRGGRAASSRMSSGCSRAAGNARRARTARSHLWRLRYDGFARPVSATATGEAREGATAERPASDPSPRLRSLTLFCPPTRKPSPPVFLKASGWARHSADRPLPAPQPAGVDASAGNRRCRCSGLPGRRRKRSG